MGTIRVQHQQGDRFLVRIREHQLVVDQPVGIGGEDQGPTPTELFVAGLAACVGFFAERFLRRHRLPVEGLAVDCEFDMSTDRPARVGEIRVRVRIPRGVPPERRQALARVVEGCTVHNSLRQAPEVRIELDEQDRKAPAA